MKALPASRMKKLAKQAVAAEVGELDELKRKWQDEIQTDIARQLTAAVLYSLNVRYGWGRVRLRRFLDELDSTFSDMDGVGIISPFDCDDLIERIKQDHGIDLVKEIQCQSCTMRKHTR